MRAKIPPLSSPVLGFALLTGFLGAQRNELRAPSPTPAPSHILSAFDVTAGTSQDLFLPASSDRRFEVLVYVDGGLKKLVVDPHDIRSPDFKLFEDDGNGLKQLPTQPSVTFQGIVEGYAESVVAASLVNGQLTAIVRLADHDAPWGIEPRTKVDPTAPVSEHIVYDSRNTIQRSLGCGTHNAVGEIVGHGHERPGHGAHPEILKIAEIACDADFEYYQKNGSNTTTTTNTITNIVNGMDAIYRRDVEIQYKITQIFVRTTSATYAATTNIQTRLTQFQNYWNANHGGVQRDMAHMFTGIGSFSGVIGIAYLGVVCNLGGAYGTSKAFSSFTTNVGLVSHECGHNWNAPHCDGQPDCWIMCSGLGGCAGNITAFGVSEKNAIIAFKNAISCLTNASPPPTLTTISPTQITAYQPGTVTLTGTNLDTVTEVRVQSLLGHLLTLTNFTRTPTSITFTPFLFPTGKAALGLNFVSVVNPGGVSSSLTLNVIGNDPPLIDGTAFLFRSVPYNMAVHTVGGRRALIFGSFSRTPSTLPGIVSFQIGAGFTDLWQPVGEVASDLTGTAATTLTVPFSVPAGLTVHMQGLVYDPFNLTLPLKTTSNVITVNVF
jgi:hypothetical protein